MDKSKSNFNQLSEMNSDQQVQDLKRLLEVQEKALVVQRTLNKIANIPFVNKDLATFFKELHCIIGQVIDAKNFFIALYENSKKSICFPYFIDTVDSIDSQYLTCVPSSELHQTLTGYVLKTKKPLLANRKQMKQLFAGGELKRIGKLSSSWLGIPLFSDNSVAGVIVVQSYSESITFTELDQELMVYVAKHIDIALERKYTSDNYIEINSELRIIKNELEERVDKRTDDLVKANQELKNILKDKEEIQSKLTYSALHDPLTGLPNRVLFMDRLLTAINRRQSREKLRFAVLFLDLDRFKVINDSLGHLAGDLLLKEVSSRISETLRPCDSVARFGGDEFCLLLEGNICIEDAEAIAKRLVKIISAKYKIQDHQVYTSPSIGIAHDRESYSDPEEILRDADAAMYQAKANGKATYEVFSNEMYERAVSRLQVEQELRSAVIDSQFDIYYQPIFNITTKVIAGFEALIRWQHPKRGFISPVEFIPIAEEIGVINKLGEFVFTHAITEFQQWLEMDKSLAHLFISINVSPLQLEQNHVIKKVSDFVNNSNINPSQVKLEITENCLVNNFENAKNILTQLSDMGFGISLDDFGTGFSSLSYLHHFPITTLKIDRSFVNNMFTKKADMAIIRTVERLASSLNIDVIAEGIETQEQFQALDQIGINSGQGYLYSKPLPPDQVTKKLQTHGLIWD